MKKLFVTVLLIELAFALPVHAALFGTVMNSDTLIGFSWQSNNSLGSITFSLDVENDGVWIHKGTNHTVNVAPNESIAFGDWIEKNHYRILMTPAGDVSIKNIVCDISDPTNIYSIIPGGIDIVIGGQGTFFCHFDSDKLGNAKTPVLIVPGVLGTNLYLGDNKLWFDLIHNLSDIGGQFMDPLTFSSNQNSVNSIRLGDVIRKVGSGRVQFNYTEDLMNEFKNQGYEEGSDLFTFPYDWRYGASGKDVNGNFVNLNALGGQIQYILNQTDAGKAAGKVDVIAHSTGGLLVKQYVMAHPNDHGIGKAVFVGVPNLGAPKALKILLNGDSFDIFGLSASEMKKLGQNMPVVYDLNPTFSYYTQAGSFYQKNNLDVNASNTHPVQNLGYNQAISELKSLGLINGSAVTNSETLHSILFDNFDMRTAGVDSYSLVGCKTATFSRVTEYSQDGHIFFDAPKLTTGDGTVPLVSATSIQTDSSKTFFAPKTSHSTLMSANGIRQQIVNILAGANLSTNVLSHDSVQANPSLCQIKGESIKIKSPVDIDVTDQSGNHTGFIEDGSIENAIPGADYETWGDHKYVFLPTDDGQEYNIKLKGTGSGTFTLLDESIDNGETTKTQVFSNLAVTTALTGNVNLGDQTTLSLDTNHDGTVDEVLIPDSIVDSTHTDDSTPPVTTANLSGIQGQSGYYRSTVNISLQSTDQDSGVLSTQFSLDNSSFQTYSNSLNVATEGNHVIKFFSTDKLGNNEPIHTVNVTIDRTAPEALIQFDPTIRDLKFTSSDATVQDLDNDIILTDNAGNTTEIKLAGQNRKQSMQAQISSILYNGIATDMSRNKFAYIWNFDKTGKLKSLSQYVQSKNTFYIYATYNGPSTQILGLDTTGLVYKSFSGLAALKVSTKTGELTWSY